MRMPTTCSSPSATSAAASARASTSGSPRCARIAPAQSACTRVRRTRPKRSIISGSQRRRRFARGASGGGLKGSRSTTLCLRRRRARLCSPKESLRCACGTRLRVSLLFRSFPGLRLCWIDHSYSHFGCNVFHEDIAFRPGVDAHAAKIELKHAVERMGGKLPAEHGHGTEYDAPRETQRRWQVSLTSVGHMPTHTRARAHTRTHGNKRRLAQSLSPSLTRAPTMRRWQAMDPLNVMNPGVGGLSPERRYGASGSGPSGTGLSGTAPSGASLEGR